MENLTLQGFLKHSNKVLQQDDQHAQPEVPDVGTVIYYPKKWKEQRNR